MLVLIPGKGVPPQGYPFADPRTGMRWGGFSQDLLGRVREIIKHRLANPAIYPQHEPQHFSIEAVTREVVGPICAKHPSYCMETIVQGPPSAGQTPTVAQAPRNPACPKCGSLEWKATYCSTCGGHKIDGYVCLKCGTKRNR